MKSLFSKFHDHKIIFILITLSMMTIGIYWDVVNYDFVNFDDPKYITLNSHVNSGITLDNLKWAFSSLYASNWHPLTWMSHMLDVDFFGMNPGFHHLTNLFIHLFNTLLLFGVFYQMTSKAWESGLVAALFTLHPMHVESVAWVSERKDVLSAFFGFLTIWAYIKYVEHPSLKRIVFVVFIFILGLMSKPMLVTLPCLLLLLDYWPLRRFQMTSLRDPFFRKKILSLVIEKMPLFILAIFSSATTIIAQKHGGALKSLALYPFPERLKSVVFSYAQYMFKMFVPAKLAVFYPYAIPSMGNVFMACLILLSVTALAVKLIRVRPYFPVGWFWFIGTLAPVIGLVQVGAQSMADRYSYIPLIGLFVIISWELSALIEKRTYLKKYIVTGVCIILSFSAHQTRKQIRHWQNSATLFDHAVRVTHRNEDAHFMLGMALSDQNDIYGAVMNYKEALLINPNNTGANNNLAAIYLQNGRFKDAIHYFTKVTEAKFHDETAHYNLASSYKMNGNVDQAIIHYQEALRINPDFKFAQLKLLELLSARPLD